MEVKKLHKDDIVIHKHNLKRMRILREINPSQYEVIVLGTNNIIVCMNQYLMTVPDYRDDVINYFID